MGAKGYTIQQKHEAIVLGALIGSEAAGLRLKVDPRTIRAWMAKAGRQPQDAISAADWSSLGEIARAQVASDLSAGKVRTKDAAVIAAIASRNVREAPPPAEPRTDAEAWADDLTAALVKHHGKDATAACLVTFEWLETLDPEGDAPSVPDVLAYLATIDLPAWRQARSARWHDEMTEQLARNRIVAEEWKRAALDDETRAILEEAERWLAANR